MQLSSKQLNLGLLISALFLCIPAFYNGMPLVFPDVCAYIDTGFEYTAIAARVWTYSAFIRHISLAETLWLVVFAQGILVALSIYLLFKNIFKIENPWGFLFYILLISLTTAASFHVSRLMPDIFTPLVIIHLSLLLFAPNTMSKKDRALSSILFFLSLSMHNSHIVILVFMLLALAIGALVPSIRMFYKKSYFTLKRYIYVLGIAIACYFFVCTLHWSIGGGFRATQGGGIFLFARLTELNIAQDYLKEHCNEEEMELCLYQNQLNNSTYFLWADASALNQTGGFSDENKEFYNDLVKRILTQPKYFKRYVVRSIEATVNQFFYVLYGPTAESTIPWIFSSISFYYPHYKTSIKQSREARRDYSDAEIALMNGLQHLVFLCSILIILWNLLQVNLPTHIRAAILLLLLGLLVNAFVVASTSGVFDRYQSRVAWLVTLPAFWAVCRFVERWKSSQKMAVKNH